MALLAALVWQPRASIAQEVPEEPAVAWVALSAGAFFPLAEDPAGLTGYAVLDEASGAPFWSSYVLLGGHETLGAPLSRPFALPDARLYQVFEYATLRWTPGRETAEVAETLDLLWAAGRDEWLLERGVPALRAPDASPLTRMAWLTDDAIRDAYFGTQYPGLETGLGAALARYGLPASLPEEREGGLIQRFDRAALRRDLTTGLVSALSAGTYLRDSGLLPASVLAPDRTVGGQLVARAQRPTVSWPNARGWGIPEPAALPEPSATPLPTATPLPAATRPAQPATSTPTPRPGSGSAPASPTAAAAAAPQAGAILVVKAVVNQGRAEHVVITNEGTVGQELTGWTIRSGAGGQQVSFPAGFVLAPGASVRVHSGSGAAAQHRPPTDLFGTGSNIWNNSGDVAILVDPTGRAVHQLSYTG